MITTLLIIWGVITTVLVILLIYRSTLSMHEDDQLFIDQSASHLAQEQTAIIARMNRLQMPVRALTTASVILLLVVFGMWVYKGLNGM